VVAVPFTLNTVSFSEPTPITLIGTAALPAVYTSASPANIGTGGTGAAATVTVAIRETAATQMLLR